MSSVAQLVRFRGALYRKQAHEDPAVQECEGRFNSMLSFLQMVLRHANAALKASPRAKDVVLTDIRSELERYLAAYR
jgi:hypothetical protein